MIPVRAATPEETRIFALAEQLLARRGLAPPKRPDQPLREAGLSSLDLVNLMLLVEEAFDLLIPEDRITPANLGSVTAVAALVRALRPAP
jgi:acyl carrier protein